MSQGPELKPGDPRLITLLAMRRELIEMHNCKPRPAAGANTKRRDPARELGRRKGAR